MHETKNEKIDASKVWVECAYNMSSCGRKRDLLPPKRDLLLIIHTANIFKCKNVFMLYLLIRLRICILYLWNIKLSIKFNKIQNYAKMYMVIFLKTCLAT